MPKRPREIDDRQASFAWANPKRILEAAQGNVLYEAPEISRLVRGRPGKRAAATAEEVKSLGLPFGARRVDGRSVCWSCGRDLPDGPVRAGPGNQVCPGCGAKIPFSE
ncbi:MAG TPA: hypothetical protein VKE22_09220 [Haliangiales bacterium]|nr:hypothetical protein [Haliangiales bacterium]